MCSDEVLLHGNALYHYVWYTNNLPRFSVVADGADPSPQHVMISYQWDVQGVVIQVRDKLRTLGFKVWLDIDKMGGSTLESMAAAVENAAVVLICVTQKYKDSPNCRSGESPPAFLVM